MDVEKNVFITDMTSSRQYHWLMSNSIELGKKYQILTHNAATVENVYQHLKNIGIYNMNIAKMRHSKIEEFRRAVKVSALKAAKQKASDLVEGIGQKIGKAIHIIEMSDNNNRLGSNTVVYGNVMQKSKSGNRQVEFEKIKIRYKISAKFKLE